MHKEALWALIQLHFVKQFLCAHMCANKHTYKHTHTYTRIHKQTHKRVQQVRQVILTVESQSWPNELLSRFTQLRLWMAFSRLRMTSNRNLVYYIYSHLSIRPPMLLTHSEDACKPWIQRANKNNTRLKYNWKWAHTKFQHEFESGQMGFRGLEAEH